MGTCVSTDKNPDSAMRFRFSIASKAKKIVIPSPTEEKRMNGENPSFNGEKQMNGENPSSNGEKQMNGENPIGKTGFQTKIPGSQLGFYSPSPRVASRDFGMVSVPLCQCFSDLGSFVFLMVFFGVMFSSDFFFFLWFLCSLRFYFFFFFFFLLAHLCLFLAELTRDMVLFGKSCYGLLISDG